MWDYLHLDILSTVKIAICVGLCIMTMIVRIYKVKKKEDFRSNYYLQISTYYILQKISWVFMQFSWFLSEHDLSVPHHLVAYSSGSAFWYSEFSLGSDTGCMGYLGTAMEIQWLHFTERNNWPVAEMRLVKTLRICC